MLERMETQIGGKYDKEESRLFEFKALMEKVGIHINFPIGNGVLDDRKDFAITHDTERNKPFHKIEVDFLRSIKESPIHIVFNIFKENEGYIGESASIEIVYALAHNKPIILLRNPVLAESVPDEIKYIINEKRNKLHIESLDLKTPIEIENYINSVSSTLVDYNLTEEQRANCIHYIRGLLKAKRQDWKSITDDKL